jgi:hypothetical protein
MKKLLFIASILVVLSATGCNASFNAAETLKKEDDRRALFHEIVSNQQRFEELLDVAGSNEAAKKTLMQAHMRSMKEMEMEKVMRENPEMGQKMMQKMMDNQEMRQKMLAKLQEKMQDNPGLRMQMMKNMHDMMQKNPEMMKEMMENIATMMEKHPYMMQTMMEKLHKNPEMMKRMKEHLENEKEENQQHEHH